MMIDNNENYSIDDGDEESDLKNTRQILCLFKLDGDESVTQASKKLTIF